MNNILQRIVNPYKKRMNEIREVEKRMEAALQGHRHAVFDGYPYYGDVYIGLYNVYAIQYNKMKFFWMPSYEQIDPIVATPS